MPKGLPVRLRKLIGLLILLLWIVVYVIFMAGVAVRVLPDAGGLVQLAFYATAGLAWILPVRFLFRWMSRP